MTVSNPIPMFEMSFRAHEGNITYLKVSMVKTEIEVFFFELMCIFFKWCNFFKLFCKKNTE